MARDINHVTVIGRLVRDPEIKYTATGVPVTKFSIANNISYMQNKELKEYVNYFDINVWGNQAVNCEKYLKKGSQVAIIGSLRQQRWNDKDSGQTKSKVEITANSVQFLTPVQSGQQGTGTSKNFNQNISNQNKSQGDQIIADPWNDNNSNESNNDPFLPPGESDDDIPF